MVPARSASATGRGNWPLVVEDLVSVERPTFLLGIWPGDWTIRWRAVVLEVARAVERVPELLGIGPHLLPTHGRPWSVRHLTWTGAARRLITLSA